MAKGKKTGGRVAGTLNKATQEIKEVARTYGPKAIAGLWKLAEGAESEQARVSAYKEVLDRGYGKASQPLSGDKDNPLEVFHTFGPELAKKLDRLSQP